MAHLSNKELRDFITSKDVEVPKNTNRETLLNMFNILLEIEKDEQMFEDETLVNALEFSMMEANVQEFRKRVK